jgi:hypothetical protein
VKFFSDITQNKLAAQADVIITNGQLMGTEEDFTHRMFDHWF